VFIRIRALRQLRFDITYRVVAEVADQPTVELGQAVGLRNPETSQVILDKAERIITAFIVNDFVANLDADPFPAHREPRVAGHADDRVAPPFLSALHRFEQIGVRLIGQFEIGA